MNASAATATGLRKWEGALYLQGHPWTTRTPPLCRFHLLEIKPIAAVRARACAAAVHAGSQSILTMRGALGKKEFRTIISSSSYYFATKCPSHAQI